MSFSSNPLSLSVPDPNFETWLRDSGYFEILDQRTSDLHRITTTKTTTPSPSSTTTPATTTATTTTTVTTNFLLSIFNHIGILLSLVTINPFSKLTNEDFAGDTPPWTLGFIGYSDSYSFPKSRNQGAMRVTENNKRYCRNYATLFIIFFACSLYQRPIALVGLVSSLALWDLFAYCGNRWGLDDYPVTRECLLRLLQCG
uniref:PRA1 family protein n=1 Tax=Tanacetum cinerariifolium TaxID=118510 RepID=A0A699IUX1_TANCI|nr:PRA1 family protein H-like [Tanacetum cinerariifolium]